jgi:hypothetical protein
LSLLVLLLPLLVLGILLPPLGSALLTLSFLLLSIFVLRRGLLITMDLSEVATCSVLFLSGFSCILVAAEDFVEPAREDVATFS